MALALSDSSLTLRDLTAKLAGGRIAGSATLTRAGAGAAVSGSGSLEDVAIAGLGGGPIGGRLDADLRVSTAAETLSGLGRWPLGQRHADPQGSAHPGGDPGAAGRALARAVEIDDPLREGRLQSLVAEELGRAAAPGDRARARRRHDRGRDPAGRPVRHRFRTRPLGRTIGYDLRNARLDARGTLTGRPGAPGLERRPATIQLGLAGPLAAPEQVLEVGALSNGLAAFVLQRELENDRADGGRPGRAPAPPGPDRDGQGAGRGAEGGSRQGRRG